MTESISWKTYLTARADATIPPAAGDVIPILQGGADVNKIKWLDFLNSLPRYAADTGAANAYAIELVPALTAHIEGMPLHFKALNGNTGASTLAVNGMASKSIIMPDGSALIAETIKAGQIITVAYTGLAYMVISDTPKRQIQPITAAVAGNALTCTLLATNLDFRAAALTSGAVNPRVIPSTSLVIPSGATLGTINAQQSRLVLIALDSAGTVELGVVNVSGGNNLDETTLISTTAISAGASANNVVYSTTARAALPFRVVGFIESTQVVAGVWASAPSTIQGQGGMAGMGGNQTWQNLTGSRAFGTTYYNTTGRLIKLKVSGALSGTTQGQLFATVGAVTFSPQGTAESNGSIYQNLAVPLDIDVPPGPYSISQINMTLQTWHELR